MQPNCGRTVRLPCVILLSQAVRHLARGLIATESLLHGFAEGTKLFEVEACRVNVLGSLCFEIISTAETCVIWVAPHEILAPAFGAFRFIVGPEAAATDLDEIFIGQGWRGKAVPGFGCGNCCRSALHTVDGCPPSSTAVIDALKSLR